MPPVPTRVFVRGNPIPHTAYAPRVSGMSYADPGTKGFVRLTDDSIRALEDYVSWTKNVARHKLPQADNYLAMFLAMLSGSYAQKYSAGMKRDPDDTSKSWAMPVPRVTGRYLLGWRVQKIRNGIWMLTNDSREAFFIEYGIHRNPVTGEVSPRRIRRPVFKLSLLRTLEHIHNTPLIHRIISSALVPRPGEPGRRTPNIKWSQSSGVMGIQPFVIGAGEHGLLRGGQHFIAHDVKPVMKSIMRHQRKMARQR